MHLAPRGQPDTLTAHFEFPNRTFAGPAVISVDEVNLGKQLSRLHLTLWQGGLMSKPPWVDQSASRRTVLAYTTHADLRNFTGISLPTGYEGREAAALPTLPDFEALKASGRDGSWEEPKIPESSPWPRASWTCGYASPAGEPITKDTLAYVVDSFPYNMHTFLAAPELRQLLLSQPDPDGETKEKKAQRAEVKERDEQRAGLWFPTVVMNLEAKTALPVEGVEWLAVRVTSKQIKDGKFDMEVIVRDVEGEMVALSHHVAMIVSLERNTKKRGSSKASL
ncbi:hypothetical protein PG997_010552 [Apiospora hydei]|uniref:Thioesterase family protein n=1 Tax=Apiospora hydei TaxID=1337664 RepID=A0ABR1W136_9PEZI